MGRYLRKNRRQGDDVVLINPVGDAGDVIDGNGGVGLPGDPSEAAALWNLDRKTQCCARWRWRCFPVSTHPTLPPA